MAGNAIRPTSNALAKGRSNRGAGELVSEILSGARTPMEPKRSLQADGSGVIITEEMMDRAFDKAYHAGELTGRYKRAYEKRMGIEDAASHSRWPAAYRNELNSKDTSLTKEQERSIEFWAELPFNLVAVALALPLAAALAVAASPFLLALFAGERIHNLLKPKFRKNPNLGAANAKNVIRPRLSELLKVGERVAGPPVEDSALSDTGIDDAPWARIPHRKRFCGATRCKSPDPVISFDRLADREGEAKLISAAKSIVDKAALQLGTSTSPKALPCKG